MGDKLGGGMLWCDTVVKAFNNGPKFPSLNPTCCFTGEVFSLSLHPLRDQPLVSEGS